MSPSAPQCRYGERVNPSSNDVTAHPLAVSPIVTKDVRILE